MRIIDFINQGGSIMWLLVGINIIGVSLIIWRFWALIDFKKNIISRSEDILTDFRNTFKGQDSIENLAKDYISAKVMDLEFGMTVIKIIATIAPLLGLLGTVVGIFDAFQVISTKGLSNPADFAQGISLALITTIGGLIVAIPHYVAHNILSDKLDKIEISLEKVILPKLLNRN